MKKCLILSFAALSVLFFSFCSASSAQPLKPKLILLISEQNIGTPQKAWWASEVDLSSTETVLANKLIAQGYTILEPSVLNKVIRQDKAFRLVDLPEEKSIKLGSLARADYVVLGKAVASVGGNVPDSNMRSCFANVTAKLIRVKDGAVVAYLDATGSSAHMDTISGGREALVNAADSLVLKIIESLNRQEASVK